MQKIKEAETQLKTMPIRKYLFTLTPKSVEKDYCANFKIMVKNVKVDFAKREIYTTLSISIDPKTNQSILDVAQNVNTLSLDILDGENDVIIYSFEFGYVELKEHICEFSYEANLNEPAIHEIVFKYSKVEIK